MPLPDGAADVAPWVAPMAAARRSLATHSGDVPRSRADDPSLAHLLGRLALVGARTDDVSGGVEADVLYEKAEQAADAAAAAGNAIRLREVATAFSLEPV